jgi:hypothetical protein
VGEHPRFAGDVTTAQTKNGKPVKKKKKGAASAGPTQSSAAERAAENGLCA